MEQMIPLTIDGVHVEVPAGTTVLEAARIAKVNIPTLCYLKDINETANWTAAVARCRLPAYCRWRPTWWSKPTPRPCARRAASIWS